MKPVPYLFSFLPLLLLNFADAYGDETRERRPNIIFIMADNKYYYFVENAPDAENHPSVRVNWITVN